MTDDGWLQQFFSIETAIAASVVASVYLTLCRFAKNHLNAEKKDQLALWLLGAYESTWSRHFCDMFDAVFGSRHLSLKCFVRSSVASVLGVFLLYGLLAGVFGVMGERALGNLSLWKAILFGTAINVVPDYLSLLETRYLLRKFERVRSFSGQAIVLICDAALTGLIILVSINLFQWVRDEAALSAVEMLGLFSVYSLFFYSTFLTSAWAWGYCLSTWFMRLFAGTFVQGYLDVENRPLEQVALVGSAIIFFVTLAFTPLLNTDETRQTSRFDELLCSVFAEDACPHVARLTPDERRALGYLAKACKGGAIDLCTRTAEAYLGSDKARAVNLWKEACDGDIAEACFSIGWLYADGRGVPQDEAKAVSHYQQACDSGFMAGCINLALMYGNGRGVPQDQFKAVSLLRRACDAEVLAGCMNLGLRYADGEGVDQDYGEAVSLFELGCDAGMQTSCFNLARMYFDGLGVPRNDTKAASLYQQACDEGVQAACINLGLMYETGRGVSQDKAKATAKYRQACAGGHALGCRNLGSSYSSGDGVEQDDAKSVSFYQLACDGGDATGCLLLGQKYQVGRGVPQDDSKAATLYEQACDNGVASGCTSLAVMHQIGRGVPQDDSLAAFFYLQACEMGLEGACALLRRDE